MKKIKNIIMIFLLLFTVVGLVSCQTGDSDDPSIVEGEECTVSFDTQGGNIVESKKVKKGSTMTSPSTPIRNGYIFEGWFKEKECVNPWIFSTEEVTEDVTLYAKWVLNQEVEQKYSVSYVINGHGTQPANLTDQTKLPDTLPVLSEEGWTFDGWYTDEALQNEAEAGAVLTANAALYAKWTKKDTPAPVEKYSVTYVINGHGEQPDNLTDQTKLPDNLPTLSAEGWRFDGWYTDEALQNEAEAGANLTANATLYAKWTKKDTPIPPVLETNEVRFNSNGGSKVETQDVEIGAKAKEPEAPTREGYIFKGWYSDAACKNAYNFNTTVVEDMTLFAKWEEEQVSGEVETNFPFAEFNTVATPKSTDGKTTEDIEIDRFLVKTGVKYSSTMLNTQGKDVYFTLSGKTNKIRIVGEGGSSAGDTTIVLQKKSGEEYVDLKTASAGNKQSATLEMEGLEAGEYCLHTDKSLKITVFKIIEINNVKKYTITYDSKQGSEVESQLVEAGQNTVKPSDPTKEDYVFGGWYLDEAYTKAFEFGTPIEEDKVLYAKWDEKPIGDDDVVYIIKFDSKGGSAVADKKVVEGRKLIAPTKPTKEGYIFIGWYLDEAYETAYNFSQVVTGSFALYARWQEIETYTIVFNNKGYGEAVADIEKVEVVPELPRLSSSERSFIGWYYDEEFKNKALEGDVLTSDVVLYAKWAEKSAVQVSDYSGNIEAAFIEWKTVKDATGYEVYSKPASASDAAYVQVDSELVRQVSTGYRADILGLAAGNYTIMIVPLYGEEEGAPAYEDVVVEAYDRSGYAHFNYTDGVGAYNDDGTLKDNAIVLYVTDENKNTVTLTCGNTTVAGIGNILNSVGQRCGEAGHENECKRTSGTKTYYAEANENEGILLKLSQAGIPLVVRFIGCVSNTGLYKAGTFNANSTPLINGLTKYDSYDWGGSVGDNGHMARMKSGKNITLEGVGEDAVIDGWGFHFMAETSGPDYGKSFEVRNLTFINTPEDAIGMEGIQSGNQITASVERCWIHNNEFYGPHISSPAESDKGEGDGSCDFKRGQYLTVSYNYFEGCHKTNLVGSSDSSLQFNLTYHHNYWKLCKARGPLSRQANIHMYNNVFDGQTDFAMNTRANAYIFSEYNLFYMAKNPHRVDSGAIKSYKDSFSSCIGEMGGTIVTEKSQKVANNCQYAGGGIDYSEFDTNPALSYIPTGNYQLQTSITDARKVIEAKGGVKKDHRTNASDVTMSSISYLNGTTPEKISSMPATLSPGKFTKKSFAFTIDRMASVTVQYATDSDDKTGVLINEAGECMLKASGTVVLTPGTYIIQAMNFQPGDAGKLTIGQFKEFTINSISFEEYNSEEYNQILLEAYENKVAGIPATIVYNEECRRAIRAAMEAYEVLSLELRNEINTPYSVVLDARTEYLAKGKAHVENLISEIGTVDETSGSAISSARVAYNALLSIDGTIVISNYQTLLNAEAAFTQYAVTSCINKINAIGTVTLASGPAIEAARAEYDSLDEEGQKSQITNINVLIAAEARYADLVAASEVDDLIENASLTTLSSLSEVVDAYKALTAAQKELIADKSRKSDIFVAYAEAMIDAIDENITISSADGIYAAEAAYDLLTADEKERVSNYSKLQSALQQIDEIGEARKLLTAEFNATQFTITPTLTGTASISTSVHKDSSLVIVSNFKVKNLTQIDLTINHSDKSVNVNIYYSTDKTNWTALQTGLVCGSNNKDQNFTVKPTSQSIDGEVYIKVEATCTKGESSAKSVTISNLDIWGYGLKYNA